MIETIEQMMRKLPPVHGKNAGMACVIGFLFGGIGLAVYFRNIVDLVFPVAISVFLVFVLGDFGWLGGGLLVALYGYYRVMFSAPVTV